MTLDRQTKGERSERAPTRSNRWQAREGAASPLGATWIPEERAYNFALYSKHATAVSLLLYGEHDVVNPLLVLRMTYPTHKSGRVWHCRIRAEAIVGATYYAYCIEGPFEPSAGHRVDPHKVLLDPYARAVYFPEDFSRAAASHPGSNAGRAPLGVLPSTGVPFDWGDDRRPVHTHDTIVYELHVRGFTHSPTSGVSPGARGTYGGVIERIRYLRELGVTIVELMPVQQFDPSDGNYWGYMPLAFFAPHLGYSETGDPCCVADEFRAMVKALHAADIEVVLDVVYNHTTEGGEGGPTYGFRGIDNSTYYLLEDDRARYRNDAGTGNVLHCANRYVHRMIVDSLRFWVREMHVDGFRFDLASIFTRDVDGRINLADPPIIAEITSEADFAGVRLIAESWDRAAYQLGRSFPGLSWHQWNARYRDDVRAFVRGDPGMVSTMMTRLYGSDDVFPDQVTHAYHAYQSVNFVTSHDGFTLRDLVSYDRKHNAANGEGGTDGESENVSWNCGWEGDAGVPPEVVRLRQGQMKLFVCLLFLSNGTPMFVAGDELGRTQRGNNNPYNQDDETTWIDWRLLEANADLARFVRAAIAFRKAHPTLCRSRFWRDDVVWRGTGPQVDQSPDSPGLAFFLRGASEGDRDLYVMINRSPGPVWFEIQNGAPGTWARVADTSLPSPGDFAAPGAEVPLSSSSYLVAARSAVVLVSCRGEPGAQAPVSAE